MRLYLYYALHAFKNQLKKLFRSWMIAFFVICIVLGGLIGLGVGLVADKMESEPPVEDVEKPGSEEETETELTEEQINAIIGLATSGIVMAVLLFNVMTADKNGSAIFLMADVNLLFPAPLKPQSVLLFRLMSKILLILFSTLYLAAQIPNLILNVGLSGSAVAAIFLVWLSVLIYGQLLNLLIYSVTSTKEQWKKYIRPVGFGIMGSIAIAFSAFYLKKGLPLLDTADLFFNGKGSRLIPIYGWMKGVVGCALEQNWGLFALFSGLLLAGIVGLSYFIWHMKVDFYEDAMAKSEETAAVLAAAADNGVVKRKKDRSDKIRRDGLNRGSGAWMFFYKSVYNRFRFAHFGVFTKTSVTYLMITVLGTAMLRFVIHSDSFAIIGFALAGMVFFRSLGNPMAKDMEMPYFTTVPENPWKKVICSVLGGSLDCFLDVLPAAVVSGVILRASVWEILGYLALAMTVDFYAGNTMLFVELSLPSSLALQIKQLFLIVFIYFGLIPIAAFVVLGALLVNLTVGVLLGAVASLTLGGIFYGLSPLFLQNGRK